MIALIAAGSLAGAASAGVEASTDGSLRYLLSLPPDVEVDADGRSTGSGLVLAQRLRAGASARWKAVGVSTEWDLGAGQVAGHTWEVPGDERRRDRLDAFTLDGIAARRAALDAALGPVRLEVGLVTSNWGLGMVANDGADEPLFGRSDFGDRVLRARATARPGGVPLFVTLAGDRVVADDLARWSEDQAAWQGIVSTLWADEDGRRGGVYGVYRHQSELLEERTTRAWMGDLFADVPVSLGEWRLRLGAEGAGILGTTDRATTYNAREEVEVRSAGAAVRTSLSSREERLRAWARGGWASGDGNPDDGVAHDFAFDRDFDVGMVLFDEVGAAVEAGTAALLRDPSHAGQAPDGVDAITTEGAFRRAAYVQPVLGVSPAKGVDLRAGVVIAWATAPVAHPFYSYRAGGTPTSHTDRPTGGYGLGTEVDWAAEYSPPPVGVGGDELRPRLLLQGGHAFQDENLGGGRADLLVLGARLGW